MNALDEKIERAADWLQAQADQLAAQDGPAAKLAQPLADDAAFLRKLKPSLIAARARGEAPVDQEPGQGTVAPSGPQLGARPQRKRGGGGGGPSPFLVIGAAFVVGVVAAKLIDWRGHAHRDH